MIKRKETMENNIIQKQHPTRMSDSLYAKLEKYAVKKNQSVNLVINRFLEDRMNAEELKEKPQT